MKINRKILKIFLIVAVILIAGIGIAYAALSTSLTITFGNTTQSVLTWDVGFSGSTATGLVSDPDDGTCGKATITRNSVIVSSIEISIPNNSCTYNLTLSNNGTIPALLSAVTPTTPTDTECTTISGQKFVCGNITYELYGNPNTLTGITLAPSGTKAVTLKISYTGEDLNTTTVYQRGGGFTLTFAQA